MDRDLADDFLTGDEALKKGFLGSFDRHSFLTIGKPDIEAWHGLMNDSKNRNQ